jgi:hypothetical protein
MADNKPLFGKWIATKGADVQSAPLGRKLLAAHLMPYADKTAAHLLPEGLPLSTARDMEKQVVEDEGQREVF